MRRLLRGLLSEERLNAIEALLGAGLIIAGVAMASRPAALVVAGILLLLSAIFSSRQRRP